MPFVLPALRLVGNQKSAGMDMNSRRTFLRQISGAALALGAGSSWSSWASAQAQSRGIQMPGEDGLLVRSSRFFDLETPVEYFDTWITPVPRFFVRNHMHEPSELTAADWRLTVAGEVEKPVTFSLAEISRIAPHSVVNTLECAGNGRGLYRPQVPGAQWAKARWARPGSPALACVTFFGAQA